MSGRFLPRECAVRIQRVQEHDIEAIARIEARCFSDPWSERAFRDALSHDRIYFACAREEPENEGGAARVLGYVVGWFAGGEGEIANLAVDPDVRGRGIGSALLDAALEEAQRQGGAQVFLEVRSSNLRARQLYESRGFTEIGRRRRYYRRPVEDAVILRRTTAIPASENAQR
jgi:[ribosomal protein S18]-alanine N-acetyltransferase